MTGPEDDDPRPDGPDGTVSRRVLLGVGVGVLGAVGGGAAGFALTRPPRRAVVDPVPPADVVAAAARERDLIAEYDAALATAAGDVGAVWTAIRAEHDQHLQALTALLPAATDGSSGAGTNASTSGAPVPSGPGAGPSTPTPTPTPTAATLAAAETAAATAARVACLAGNGTAAVLLAMIAASETTHAQVLT